MEFFQREPGLEALESNVKCNGIQVLSKRYNLPVLPIYIDAYNMNRKIQILVGKPLYQDTHLVAEKIRELYLELKKNSYIREKNYVQS